MLKNKKLNQSDFFLFILFNAIQEYNKKEKEVDYSKIYDYSKGM